MRNKNPRNIWRFWRPIYGFTWATWQASSYAHYASYLNALQNSIVLDIGTGTGEYIKSLKKMIHVNTFLPIQMRNHY